MKYRYEITHRIFTSIVPWVIHALTGVAPDFILN
jgi:hypothetical protein